MGKLERELEEHVSFVADGGGFGGQDAIEQHDREIEHLRFKITQRNNFRIAILSASIGAIFALVGTVAVYFLKEVM